MIFSNLDWNPQQDMQAISRAHRIGQEKPVLILRLVSVYSPINTSSRTEPGRGNHEVQRRTYTVEQRLLQRAKIKVEAERTILAKGKFDMQANLNLERGGSLWDDDLFESKVFQDESTFASGLGTIGMKSTGTTTIDGLICDELIDLSHGHISVFKSKLNGACCRIRSEIPNKENDNSDNIVVNHNTLELMTCDFRNGFRDETGKWADWAPWLQEDSSDIEFNGFHSDLSHNSSLSSNGLSFIPIPGLSDSDITGDNNPVGYRKSKRQRTLIKSQSSLNEDEFWKNVSGDNFVQCHFSNKNNVIMKK